MAYTIIENYVPASKYALKCPYTMNPIGITVHNTANDASAKNEIAYMVRNDTSTSYHVAVDDVNVILGVPFNRNAWHAGDGNGNGNRKTIGIEICYSKSGGTKFDNAEKNAAKYIATLLKKYGWTTKNVYRHKDWSGKDCPHRTMANGWTRFVNMIQEELDKLNGKSTTTSTSTTSNPTTAKKPDVQYQVYAGGKWWGVITNYNNVNSNGYAGVFGKEISGIRVKLSNGKKVTVMSHISGNARNNWLPAVTKWDNTENGYSGWKGKPTDCIAMKADGHTLKYRVHVKGGGWLNWISKYDINNYDSGLAGVYGKPIDAVQITVV